MNYRNLSIVEYDNQFFNDNFDHTLVDVRTTSEYASGHIPGAVSIPLSELQHQLHEIPRNQPIVMVCASGNRSLTGSQILAQAGYQNVYNLNGGTMTWMLSMRPIDR